MPEHQTNEDRLGKYELSELTDQGTGGKVYRARDTDTGEEVTLKIFPGSVEDNSAFAKYFYEKSTDERNLIEHPNVLHMLEVGKIESRYYAAFEDPGGQTLAERLREAPLPVDQCLEILHEAAEGLRAAHRRDVVHGHLKPSDIILTTDQTGRKLVKVSFMDLAVAAPAGMVSIFGELIGSPKYLAPEVIRGRLPNPQSDVFSLGIIAYEMFTGREPFSSDHTLGYLFANCREDPVPAEQAAEEVPHEAALVLNRMLEKEPNRRYRSMQRVMDDLDRCTECLRTGRVEVVPYGTDSAFARDYELPRPEKETRSRKPSWVLRAGLLAAALLAGVLLVVGISQEGWGLLAADQPAKGGPAAEEARPDEFAPEQRGAPSPAQPGPQQPPPERAASQADPQQVLRGATADWRRYRENGDYEMAAAGFEEVLSRFPDSPAAPEAARQLAHVYVEWGADLAEEGEFEKAVQKYRKAAEAGPADSRYAGLARDRLPEVVARWAEDAKARGNYAKALQLYEELASEHPGTVEGNLLRARKPEIMLLMANRLWREEGDYDRAIGTFAKVAEQYAGTEWAEKAERTLPKLYLEAVGQQLEEGDYEGARRRLERLAEAYPQHPAAERAAELQAEIAFGLFQRATEVQNDREAARHLAALLQEHPSSVSTVKAVRTALDLQRAPGEPTFSPNTAGSELDAARKAYDQFDFSTALTKLRGVVRYARADSTEAQQATALLPEWRYGAACYQYGRGSAAAAKDALEKLEADFPQTRWARRAGRCLKNIKQPPEGMVFVPRGRFRMGTDLQQIAELIKEKEISPLGDEEEAVKATAEFYGLLSETPRHTAATDGYFIDATEVTNEQYARFVEDSGWPAPPHWREGTYPKGAARLPVVNVTLSDAKHYAEWRGGRIPTEIEWEKAARGTAGFRFPWGNTWKEDRAHHMLSSDAGPAQVGSYPNWDSPYGCLDMIGNVQEWTVSDFRPYEDSQMSDSASEGAKVTRGGAWQQQELVPIPSSCASRYPWAPSQADPSLGFRCVRDAPPPQPGE